MWCDRLEGEETREIDRLVAEVLARVSWEEPPVDVLRLAPRLGMSIAVDARQEPRGRHVRLGGRTAIFVRPEPRQERLQWTVAHEVGEALVHRLESGGAVADWSPGEREQRANLLASRLLLPAGWFERDAREAAGDLYALKQRYATASHELIA